MKLLKHPKTGKQDVILTLTALAVLSAIIKFLIDGMSIQIFGHTVTVGHTDSMTYATFLAPLLGAHSYMDSKTPNIMPPDSADNPDA